MYKVQFKKNDINFSLFGNFVHLMLYENCSKGKLLIGLIQFYYSLHFRPSKEGKKRKPQEKILSVSPSVT